MKSHSLLALVGAVLVLRATPSHAAAPEVAATRPAITAASVSGFSPTTGRAGTQVTITGLGFLASDRVLVDGRAVKAPTITATSITFAVPAGVRKGAITLRHAGMKALAVGTFAVLPDAKISAIVPTSGRTGTPVEIRGSGFLSGDTVQFGGKPLTPVSLAADKIVVVVPAGTEEDYFVVGTTARSPQRFKVVLPPPSIGSFAPGNGPPGTKVTILGTSFSKDDRAYLGTTPLTIGTRSDTRLEVTIPVHAKTSQPLTVKGARGASTSSQVFGVILPPVLKRFEPLAGAPGTRVTIHGEHFLPGDQVQHDGLGLRMVDYEEQRLIVEVGPDAQSGAFEIFRDGQKLATAGKPFEVLRTPAITGFSPAGGPAGTRVTITGKNFAPEATVRYGTQTLRVVERSANVALTVEIPRGPLGYQPFTLETHGGTAVSTTPFEVFRYSVVRRVTPTVGRQGTRVTVSGSDFGASDRFFLGEVELGVLERKPDACVVLVPSTASTGPIVWESHGKRQTSRFTFTLTRPPTLTSFTPGSGPAGSLVTMTGTDFTKEVTCRFGSLSCRVVRRKLPTEIVVEIPKNAAGTDFLWIESEGKRYKASPSFQVIAPPMVASFTPVAGAAGSEVVVRGANFTATTAVQLGTTPAEVVSQKPGELVVKVPAVAPGSYALTITDATFKVRASGRFKVAIEPRVTSVAPLTGTAGTEVTLTGENFGARALVWFGGVACAIVRREGKTKLVVTLPPGTSGKEYFTVTDGGKKATAMQVFEAR